MSLYFKRHLRQELDSWRVMYTKKTIHLNLDINKDNALENQSVRKKLTLINAAKRGLSLVGDFSSDCFPEIAKISNSTQIRVELVFYLQNKVIGVKGTINTTLVIECQRCLSAMPFLVKCNSELTFNLDGSKGDNKIESILVLDNYVDMTNIISDEILLTLPLSPKHRQDCQMNSNNLMQNDIPPSANNTYKPFAQLKQIRKQN